MLKYNIKLTDDSIKLEKLVWSEKYLALDLSFVSGVTSQDYHLEKFNVLPLTNSDVDNMNSSANLKTENVSRQGYIVIKKKEYELNKGSVVDYSVESEGLPIEYYFLFLNGKYYYAYDDRKFKIKNWLVPNEEGVVEEQEIEVEFADTDETVKIDTVVWIEDGIASIDGNEYVFDKEVQIDAEHKGGLKYFVDGDCLDATAITKCSDIEYYPFVSTSDYDNITKFVLTKQEEINEPFEKISFCRYFFYVKYKENYLPIRIKMEDSEDGKTINYTFVCDIPNYLVMENPDPYYETHETNVYRMGDDLTPSNEVVSGTVSSSLRDSITFDILLDFMSYITIENENFIVEYDVMNANDSNRIAIYLTGDASNFAIGDKIKLIDSSLPFNIQYVYAVDDYGFNKDEDTNFILFNGKKYKLEKNLCDKVIINDNEYSIEYINGKVAGKDCLVLIADEEVPMKIVDDSEDGGKLERYGRIISGDSNVAIVAQYDIKTYSGITVDNEKYIILSETVIPNTAQEGEPDNGEYRYYARLDRSNEYTFLVENINGSSMVVCEPDINTTDFTTDFNQFISREICKDVVDNQYDMVLYTKNKIFGDKEITEELAFQMVARPVSSDDYFSLFDNLEVFSKSGYIHIPLSLSNSQGNNVLQDDIVEKQFFDDVKKRSINPIVDMEKDVYVPKYIANNSGMYSGSETEFKPIKEIRVNLHFRTRNLDSWKVNEGYNDVSTENITDNWFVTDYHPYKDILNDPTKLINKETFEPYKNTDKNEVSKILLSMPDLVGLLNFTNDDVYYQKSKIAKSFLRFSFYDSIDQQKQSLLATSCVFMDEHRLFKRFIDNSRKNINDFGYISEPVMEQVEGGNTFIDDAKGRVTNKINVMTEFLGKRVDNTDTYLQPNNPYTSFGGVIIDENHRLGSEFIIDNKYETDTSSEGFYIYIFREYSENLTPKPIYMKIEFNHAGIGRTIPFILPMKWETMKIDGADSRNGKQVPTKPYELSSEEDITALKRGIKLEDVYAQSYIPLYAVYDFQNKEYAYVFDSRYVEQDENDVINLNLFELKIANDDNATEGERRTANIKNQATAIIDMNKNQFDIEEKNCDL